MLMMSAVLFITLISQTIWAGGSLTNSSIEIPSFDDIWRVITLHDYNTRVVVLGTMFLGIASGLVGTFLLLRKRSLLSDAVSHATLPGICAAFIIMTMMGGNGKSLTALLTGAAITGTIGMLAVLGIRNTTRLKDDAALGIILSVFFGIGAALLNIITRMQQGNAAGLESFIYGKTASMLFRDALLIAIVAALVALLCIILFKEFAIVCFDQDYASTQGWPSFALDLIMMALVVIVTVIGLQAVGLILVVALLIIPPAAARFWTFDLRKMLFISGALGGLGGLCGSAISALMSNLPAGAVIVLTVTFFFLLSLLFGTARGLLLRLVQHQRLTRKVSRQHLLRALFEMAEIENKEPVEASQSFDRLLGSRSWSNAGLRRVIKRAEKDDLVLIRPDDGYVLLTEEGVDQARILIRNHRLWELFLITHADIAPSHVDRDADMIEHVLDAAMIHKLESMLMKVDSSELIPKSPHILVE